MAFLLVATSVALNVVGALTLKYMADHDLSIPIEVVGLGIVCVISATRFGLWGVAHKRYPLSSTYPMTGIFFPIILAVSHLYGELIGAQQLAGAFLITAGVFYLALKTG